MTVNSASGQIEFAELTEVRRESSTLYLLRQNKRDACSRDARNDEGK